MVRIGLIGCGYWGPKLLRNFANAPGTQVVAVCDLRPERLSGIRESWPGLAATVDADELLRMPDLDAVIVATPVATHFDLAFKALQAGKHVLVEKPLAPSAELAQRLTDEADRQGLVLMVDHTFVYSGAVRAIGKLLADDGIGEMLYYDSVRVNLGLFRHDVNVLWDLAVHDLSIIDYLVKKRPSAVSATGLQHYRGEQENIAYITLFFGGSLIAHVHVNWLAPVKVRHTLIGGAQKMIVYNDLEPIEKVKVYDRGIMMTDDPESILQMRVGYRTGDMWAPWLDDTEALRTEALHFIDCVANAKRPITDGQAGLRVVRILEAATQSMADRGRPVELPQAGSGA